jgi:Family of unknown function (DUF5681)
MADTPAKPHKPNPGQFQKGQSGNPGGRPKMPDELKAAMQGLADTAVKVLKDAMNGDDPRARILAANAVLDRGYGKPAQTVNAKFENVDMSGAHLAALQELAAKTRDPSLSVDGVNTTALAMLTAESTTH